MLYDVIWPQYDIGDVLQTSDALELVVLTRILQKWKLSQIFAVP